jgi:hypothetical protein
MGLPRRGAAGRSGLVPSSPLCPVARACSHSLDPVVCPAVSGCVSSALSVGLVSGKDCSEGDCDPVADRVEQFAQERIPAAEKMKWGLDGSLGSLQDFNAPDSLQDFIVPGDLKACCDLSRRYGVLGGSSPSDSSRRPILRPCDEKGKSGVLAVEEDGWSVVKPKFWWRKSSNFLGDFKQQDVIRGTDFFKQQLRGKCFNCLASDHFAYLCSAPVRCWQCLQAGHKARSCPGNIYLGRSHSIRDLPGSLKHSIQKGSNFSSSYQLQKPLPGPLQMGHERQPTLHTSSVQPNKSYLQAVQGGQVMEARYPGDPRARPARAVCAISATGSIRRRRDELISKAVVCSFDGNSHEVDMLSAGDMLREAFDLHHGQYQLVKHFPEQFFIIFSESRIKQWALDRRSVSYRGRVFHFGDWSEESYARKTNFEFRVKVRVEGIPVHCWGEEVAARALGKSCAIHYVQERSRRKERTRSFDLWAWCSDPCDIPKEVSLSVAEPDRELPPPGAPLPLVGVFHELPTDLKEGHVYTIRNHIEVVEDLSFIRGRDAREGPTCRRPRREFVWSYGVPDSIGEKRERSEDRRGRDFGHRGWDHDDDEDFQQDRRHGTRRHRSLSGWARSSRCRGGPEDCFSSSGRRRPATPFRRRGLVGRWIPKVKVRSVSFADPLISAVWPPIGVEELEDEIGAIPAGDSISGVLTAQQPRLAVPSKVCSAEHLGFSDVVLSQKSIEIAFPNPDTILNPLQILDSARETAAPILLNQQIAYSSPDTSLSALQIIDSVRVPAAPNSLSQPLVAESHVPPHSNINSASVMPCNPDLFTSSLSCSIPDPSSINIDEFVASISKAPDAPLIRSPPSSSLASNSLVVGCSIQPAVAAGVSPSPIGKRSSARLAAKKKLKFGRNRNAIVKAQEILAAKLNNAAATQFQSSNALSVNGQVDLMEQLARHFIRPLTKDQMEAIMELAIQGKEKEGTKKKGRKVAPLKAPFIEAAERI